MFCNFVAGHDDSRRSPAGRRATSISRMRSQSSLTYLLWLVALSMLTLYLTLRLLLPLAGVPLVDIV